MIAYEMKIEQLEVFFTICNLFQLDSVEDREWLMSALAREKFVERMWSTNRTKEKFIKDLAKHYSVLRVDTNKEDKKYETR